MRRVGANAQGRLLLDVEAAHGLTDDAIRGALLPLIRSNIYRVNRNNKAVEIDGPDVSHQLIDPDLQVGLAWLGVGSDTRSRLNFREERSHFALSLEDSWCGEFLARHLATLQTDEPLTIIHLDDHTDMMSTLLVVEAGADGALALKDPLRAMPFDASVPADWRSAIAGGAIGIGSFLTPFFALNRRVELFHLKADQQRVETCSVMPTVTGHDLLAGYQFHSLEVTVVHGGETPERLYCRSSDEQQLLAIVPHNRRVAVHIDLDYFLNDYNGNAWQVARPDVAAKRKLALDQLDPFFAAVEQSGFAITCWMIGVSPGFCSALHWQFLIEQIERRIADLKRDRWTSRLRSC